MDVEKPNAQNAGSTVEPEKKDVPEMTASLPCKAVAQLELGILKTRLKLVAQTWAPAIYKRGTQETVTLQPMTHHHVLIQEMGIVVPDWSQLGKNNRGMLGILGFGAASNTPRHSSHSTLSGKMPLSRPRNDLIGQTGVNERGGGRGPIPKLSRAVKSKSNGSGRTYTSKYRGVHQTFPTKRWEAQFRRNGKPTSLGCFDHEDQAAKAYDKMMLWCELHNAAGMKSGITNFEASEYERDVPWLSSVTQDELIEALRSDGRRQAAHRMLRQKREGQVGHTDDEGPSSSAPLDN